jgi:hypothetical protein
MSAADGSSEATATPRGQQLHVASSERPESDVAMTTGLFVTRNYNQKMYTAVLSNSVELSTAREATSCAATR